MKPLLVFGLRGTLLERIHVRRIPDGMPAADLTVGLTKVWLRPHMQETLLALQKHCNIAIWSSTTARNTAPLVDAVFQSPRLWEASGLLGAATSAATSSSSSSSASSAAAQTDSDKGAAAGGNRFSKRPKEAAVLDVVSSGAAARPGEAAFVAPLTFQFVWSREHTTIDSFRRMNMAVRDDAHATVKDLSVIWRQMPHIATPANTILIDDTPSKAKLHADNYLWLDTCEAFAIQDADGMKRLRQFIEEEIVGAPDVRAILPRRVRASASARPPTATQTTVPHSSPHRPRTPHRQHGRGRAN